MGWNLPKALNSVNQTATFFFCHLSIIHSPEMNQEGCLHDSAINKGVFKENTMQQIGNMEIFFLNFLLLKK